MRSERVAVVVTCHNLGRTVREAVESVVGQTQRPAELVIVDDGSDDLCTVQEISRLERSGCRVERMPNRGVSAARNHGIRATSTARLVLLDADDMLAPRYLEALGARLDQDPALDFVSCAQMGFGAASYLWRPPDPELPDSIIRGVVHASSMFRREVWAAVGGFDETIPRNEVLDFWTTVLEHGFRGAVIDEPLLLYRVRRDSQYHVTITDEAMDECMRAFYRKHWHTVEAEAEKLFVGKEAFLLEQYAHQAYVVEQIAQAQRELAEMREECALLRADLESRGCAPIDFGELRRTTPLSPRWGVDRGRPIDRYYIERFLDLHRQDIHGRVLEVKDPGYTRMFGQDRVTQSDVLDIDTKNEQANIHADLSSAPVIPDHTYDAVILTQVLGLIYDVENAVREVFRTLRPGGVLLCTVAAAGRISHEDAGADGDFWRFTEASLRRLFANVFPLAAFEITGFGNVLADTGFLYGLADHELRPEDLDVADPWLPLVYAVRAVKPERAGRGSAEDRKCSQSAQTVAARRAVLGRTTSARAVILAYHQVTHNPVDRARTVPVEVFRRQMDYVRERCTPMALDDLAHAAFERRLPDRAVAVTLDDGYLDCLTEAAPIVVERAIPATAFVTGQGGEREFYWNLLDRLFAPESTLPDELHLPDYGLWHVPTRRAKERTTVRRRLNEHLYAMTGPARRALAAHLRAWSGRPEPSNNPRPLTETEIRQLALTPGMTIGAHGCHHLCLPLHHEDAQRSEVQDAKRWLEETIGREVIAFAYPYGERNPTTLRVVRQSGFTVAVTVDGRAVVDGLPRLLLPRCEVPDLHNEGFGQWLEALF